MRKVIISSVVLCMTALSINAQVFVGGNLGVNYGGGKATFGSQSEDLPSTFSFSLVPKVGFYVNDDIAIGVQAGIMSSSTTQTFNGTDYAESLFGWTISGFGRLNMIEAGNLSLLIEGTLGITGATPKFKSGGQTNDGDPITIFGIGIAPILSYSFTSALSVEMSCDFLRLGFNSLTVKDADDSNYKTTVNAFGLGVNSFPTFDILESVFIDDFNPLRTSPITVGVIFKF